jgi:spermidine/putrescine transport system substrate-binding protein
MNPRLTRNELLRRGAAGGALLAFPSLLAACGGGDGGGGGEDGGELKTVLNFANWPFYIDVEKPTTLQDFTKQTQIKVNYFEEINDNAEYFAKVQGPLSQGNGIDRDIFVFTDNSRFPGLLVGEGWVEELDKDLIPNISNLVDAQASPPFDPDRTYSLPWQSGMTGIAWNEELTGPVTSVQQLLEDPKLKGKVTLLQELADSVGLVMLQAGDDPTSVSDETFNKAIDTVQAAVDSGQIRRFTGNDYAQPLANGDLAAAFAWSGDVAQITLDNPDVRFAVPDSGGMLWSDNFLIPIGTDKVTQASQWINFFYDPENAAALTATIQFISPVQGTAEALTAMGGDAAALVDNPLVVPTDEFLAQLAIFGTLDETTEEEFDERFSEIIGTG